VSTRAKAPNRSTEMDPFYSGAWTKFTPGLTPDHLDGQIVSNLKNLD